MKNILLLIVLAMFLTSCSKSVQEIQVTTVEVSKTPLNLPNPDPLKLQDVEWIIITKDNAMEIFEKLKGAGGEYALFAVEDTGYEKIQINFTAYEELRARADFFSPHLFCTQGITEAGQTFARHFGSPPDTFEDPFTGSATGGMAAYLWHYNLIEEAKFIAEQGHWMNRPGQASVEVIGPRNNISTVKVGGKAVTIVRGELSL